MLLDHVCDLAPGLFVASVLEMVDPAALSPRDAVRYLQIHERVASWWASRANLALVAAAGLTPTVEEFILLDRLTDSEREIRIRELPREEIASALRWGPVTTQARIDQARLLAGPLAPTQKALALGEITPGHVRVVSESVERLSSWEALENAIIAGERAEGLEGIEGESTGENAQDVTLALIAAQSAFNTDCGVFQGKVLPTARRQGYSATKSKANREISVIDAAGQARRREAARRHRDVYVTPDTDGISTLIARLDSITANAIMAAINAAVTNPAITSPCEAGSCDEKIGERRGHALAALIFGTPILPGTPGTNPPSGATDLMPIVVNMTLDLTVPITELQAQASASTNSLGCDFAQLLSDPAVRVFARPVAISDTGHVLDVGRRRYQITGVLRRLITTRDGVCRFPGCHRNATKCQIDHVQPWDEGGGSDVGNLGALCVRHHQLKTHGRWEITDSKPDGTCTWISPDGLIYRHHPPPLVATDTVNTNAVNTNAVNTNAVNTSTTDPPDEPKF